VGFLGEIFCVLFFVEGMVVEVSFNGIEPRMEPGILKNSGILVEWRVKNQKLKMKAIVIG
jgi:hypothetical protein